jgi:hypothetical protein
MTVTSLSRMTVPLGTDTAGAGSQGMLMPKLKYRFRVTLLNFGFSSPVTELSKQVIDFTRPSLSFEDIPIEIYNSRIYVAGKHTWESLTLNVRDDASGQVSRLVGQQLQKQFDFQEQASAASGIDYKFVTKCEILNGANGTLDAGPASVLETWEMYGCYIQQANYNDLNYGSNEAVTISLTIRFDNATQDPLGQGVGSPTPRTISDVATG